MKDVNKSDLIHAEILFYLIGHSIIKFYGNYKNNWLARIIIIVTSFLFFYFNVEKSVLKLLFKLRVVKLIFYLNIREK